MNLANHDQKCCAQGSNPDRREQPGLVLVGNMNVGKSTLFRQLCREITTVQFPGTTVSIKKGTIQDTGQTLFLTPGICSIFSRNEDELVSRDILLSRADLAPAQGVVLVADAKNITRSLAIAFQYAEYGLPMLLAVNMVDEASSRGVEIDFNRLSEILGVKVCPTIAKEGVGLRSLVAALKEMRPTAARITYPDWVELFLEKVAARLEAPAISPRGIGLLLLAEDREIENYLARRYNETTMIQLRELAAAHRRQDPEGFRILVSTLYNNRAEQVTREIQRITPPTRNPFLVTLGDWCTQLHTGIPIAMAVVAAMYLFVGSFAATLVVDTINATLFEGFLIPLTVKLVAPIPSAFIRDMIVDPDFGILPTGVFLALGLVLPVFFCFYIAFGILQDSGYLPRLSILLNKIFQKMGLNGKGVIPLIMGFSCVTMAILTTRMLGSNKERIIATLLLLLGIPCAPLIAVMLIILGRMPVSASLAVFGLLLAQVFVAGVILNKILPGTRSPFLMEIPPLRIPKLTMVVKNAARRTYFFMKETVPIFILASLVVFLFQRLGGLEVLERAARPLITSMMGLPEKSVQVFIKTIIRRESGAAELEHLHNVYTNRQLVVNLLVMTVLTPCMNAIIVLFKERGAKVATVIVGAVLIYAITAGTLLNHACRLLGITFS